MSLKESDFYHEPHQVLYQTICHFFQRNLPLESVSISQYLQRKQLLDKVGGRAYIEALMAAALAPEHAPAHAKIVRETSLQRQLIQASKKIADRVVSPFETIQEPMDYALKTIIDISREGIQENFEKLGDVAERVHQQLLEQQETDMVLGVESGFSDLDDITNGFQKGDLIILAARPSMGKTTFILRLFSCYDSKYP